MCLSELSWCWRRSASMNAHALLILTSFTYLYIFAYDYNTLYAFYHYYLRASCSPPTSAFWPKYITIESYFLSKLHGVISYLNLICQIVCLFICIYFFFKLLSVCLAVVFCAFGLEKTTIWAKATLVYIHMCLPCFWSSVRANYHNCKLDLGSRLLHTFLFHLYWNLLKIDWLC